MGSKVNCINVYSLNWDFLGKFWSASNYGMSGVGDVAYLQNFDGPLLTKDGEEYSEINPISVYLKIIETRDMGESA